MEAPSAHHHALRRAGVPVGLLAAPNARPPGSLRSPSVCAPKCSFGTFRCSAWLIRLRQRTALSPPKRSCFRFASLALRWAGEASLPPCSAPKCSFGTFRCSGRLFSKRPCYGLFSETLDLQVRFAHPPVGGGSSAPPCTPLSCPRKCGDRQAATPSAGKALFRSTPWISLPLCISPGGLVLPAHAAPTGGKTCSIHSRRNTLAAPGLFLLSYRSFFFSYFS